MTDDQKEAWKIATRMLSRREYTCKEIRQKLNKKGIHSEDADIVLEELIKNGYQSDERFAEHFTRFRASKGYGPKRIRLELKEKGVAAQLIEQGLEQAEVNWLERVAEVHEKKFKGQVADTWEEKNRQTRFLDYRGFTQEQIDSCISNDE
jgi:regulatory protein